MVWYGMVWYGMVWYGMVWYGMVWYGMVWYIYIYIYIHDICMYMPVKVYVYKRMQLSRCSCACVLARVFARLCVRTMDVRACGPAGNDVTAALRGPSDPSAKSGRRSDRADLLDCGILRGILRCGAP